MTVPDREVLGEARERVRKSSGLGFETTERNRTGGAGLDVRANERCMALQCTRDTECEHRTTTRVRIQAYIACGVVPRACREGC